MSFESYTESRDDAELQRYRAMSVQELEAAIKSNEELLQDPHYAQGAVPGGAEQQVWRIIKSMRQVLDEKKEKGA